MNQTNHQENNQARTRENQTENQTNTLQAKILTQLKKRFEILSHKHNIQPFLADMSKTEQAKYLQRFQQKYGQGFGSLLMTDKEYQEYYTLQKELEKNFAQQGLDKIKKLNYKLIKAPSAKKLEGFAKQNIEQNSNKLEPSEEFVRIALAGLPKELQSIFNEFFSVRFIKNEWSNSNTPEGRKKNQLIQQMSGGAFVKKFKDPKSGQTKFMINVDQDAFYEEYTKKVGNLEMTFEQLNANKFLYLVTRSILATISNKSEIKEYLKKTEKLQGKKLDENCDQQYDDWIAYFLSHPDKAKKANPKLYDQTIKWLKNSFKNDQLIDTKDTPDSFVVHSSKINQKYLKPKQAIIDPVTGDEIDPASSPGWAAFLGLARKTPVTGWMGDIIYALADKVESAKLAYKEAELSFMSESYEKEMKYLLARDLGGGDYLKLLKHPMYNNDKDRMRALIMVFAKKNNYHWQFGQLWLWKFDETFKRTKGREVSIEGFDFITKISKLAGGENKVAGTVEYKQIGNKFMRMERANQVARFDAIFQNFSLRDIQRAKPDLFNNLYNTKTNKFISLDAKLGQADTGDKFYIQNDVNLNQILPPKEAESFVNDMQDYEKQNNDEGFNRLIDPVVESLIKKYLQESRREPMLFNMYTAPRVKEAFEYYKDYIDTPEYEAVEYNQTYQTLKDELDQHDQDFEETFEDLSYEDTLQRYKDFYKEKREMPYTRGKQATKYGKLRETIRQSQIKFRNLLQELQVSDSVKKYLNTQIDKYLQKESISVEETDKLKADLDQTLAEVEPEKSKKIRNYLNDLFLHLEDYAIVKGYQQQFRPYVNELSQYSGKDKTQIKEKQLNQFRKWLLFDLMLENTSINDKMINIQNRLNGKIIFSQTEKNELLSVDDQEKAQQQLIKLTDRKLKELQQGKAQSWMREYSKLNGLYFTVNQKIQFPEEIQENFDQLKSQVLDLNLIPDSEKSNLANLKQLAKKLRIAKAVNDDHYEEQTNLANYRYGRNLGYDSMIEEELEEEELGL